MQGLLKNISITFIRQGLSIIVYLALTVILTKTLSQNHFGQFSLLLLYSQLFPSLLIFGIPAASTYILASNRLSQPDFLRSIITIWVQVSTVGVIITFLGLFLFGEFLLKDIPLHLKYLPLIVFPINTANAIYLSIYQGKKDFNKFNALSLIQPIIQLTVLLIFFFNVLNVDFAILAYLCSAFISFSINTWLFTRNTNFKLQSAKTHIIEFYKYGIKVHLSNVLTLINYRADIIIINFYVGNSIVAIYIIAVQIAEKLWLLSQSISSILFPLLAEEYNSGDIKKPYLKTIQIAQFSLYITIIGAIILAGSSYFVIPTLFGEKYLDSFAAIIILLPGICFTSMARILSNDIAAQGKPHINANIALFTVILNVILNIITIPTYGELGAAFTTSLTYFLNLILKIIYFSKINNVKYSLLLIPQFNIIILVRRILNKVEIIN